VRCGTKSCGCHRDAQLRHGPHLYLKFRDSSGRSRGIYVPRSHAEELQKAVAAWKALWDMMMTVGEQNRTAFHQRLRARKRVRGRG
jgi:hypothetical protein